MEKKIRERALNICFREDCTPNEVITELVSLKKGESTQLNRVVKIDRVVEQERKLLETNGQKNDEEIFQAAYEKMSGQKKVMYRVFQLTVPEGTDLDSVKESLEKDRRVEFVTYDHKLELYGSPPNDTEFANLWAMPKIKAEEAWEISQGEDVVVAVVDTGVDYNHPDLRDNMWELDGYPGFYGYDFSDYDPDPMDYDGHGTHVAGTIAAILNNNQGVAGVAPKAKIMAIKIFPYAYESNIADALVFAVDLGAKILNNSWGYSYRHPYSPLLEAAIDYVYSMGAIAIFSAGNANDETQYYSPQNHPKTIAVAATDINDQRAYFSNYGPSTDVAAPGVNILSCRRNGGYVYLNGTSMACPHVVGQAALLMATDPSLTFEQVREAIVNSADPIVTDRSIGSGRINLINPLKVATDCVAFTVNGNSHVSSGPDQLLNYTDVAANEGSAWDGSVFTAPVSGVYHFAISFVRDALRKRGTRENVSILLKHNNQLIGRATSPEGDGWAGAGAYAASLKLAKGDTISTFINSEKGLKRHVPYYTFCGHLVCSA